MVAYARLAVVIALTTLGLSCANPESDSTVKFEDSHLLQLGETRNEFLLEPARVCSKADGIKASDDKFVLQFYVTGDANQDTSGTAPIRYQTDANGALKYWTLIITKKQLEAANLSVLASEAVGIKAMTNESLLGIVCPLSQAASNRCTPPNTAALEAFRAKVKSGACGDANAAGSGGRLKASCKEGLFDGGGAFVGVAYPINVRGGGFVSGDVTMPLHYEAEACETSKSAALALSDTNATRVDESYKNSLETVKHTASLSSDVVPPSLADTAAMNVGKDFDTLSGGNKSKQDSLNSATTQGTNDTASANGLQSEVSSLEGQVSSLEGQVSAIEAQKKAATTTAVVSSVLGAVSNIAASMPPLSLGGMGSPGSECFIEGTLIQVEKKDDEYGNWKPIEKIRAGDRIVHPLSHSLMTVTELVVNPYKNTLYTVHAGSGKDALTITVTDEHPFFSRGGLVAASALKEGIEVLTTNGYLAITKIEASAQGKERKVYNLIHERSKVDMVSNITAANGFVTGLFVLQNELSKLKQDSERLSLELQKVQTAATAAQQQVQELSSRKATLESRLAQLKATP